MARTLQTSFAGGEMTTQMFSRPDDVRFRNGAAKIENFVCRPQGALLRRPGTTNVRAVSDSTYKSRLLPFVFSNDQSAIVEAAAAAAGRPVGHFRFHVDGGSQLYSKPPDYIGPNAVTQFNVATSTFQTPANHPFTTGDPVVITLQSEATAQTLSSAFPVTATDTDQTFRCAWAGAVPIGSATGNPQQVIFYEDGGTLPPNMEFERFYWITSAKVISGSFAAGGTIEYTFSETFEGPNVKGAGVAGTATVRVSGMPDSPSGTRVEANQIYYAIEVGGSPTLFQIAETKSDALAGTAIQPVVGGGVGDFRYHFGYVPGDSVDGLGGGAGTKNFYCSRTPWCSAPNPFGFNYCYDNDHQGHAPPAATNFWHELPGQAYKSGTITIDPADDTVDVGSAHGLIENDPVLFDIDSGGALPTATPAITADTVYYVKDAGTNDFKLSATVDGEAINITAAGSLVNVLVAPVYEIPHHYYEDELERLNLAQSNDVLSIASLDHPVAELRRVGATRWELADVVPGSLASAPTASGNSTTYSGKGNRITDITGTDLLTTAQAHGLLTNDIVYVSGLSASGLNDGFYVVGTIPFGSDISFRLKDKNTGVAQTGWTNGSSLTGTVRRVRQEEARTETYVVTSIDENGDESVASDSFTLSNDLWVVEAYNDLSWGAGTNASSYRVYKLQDGVYGLIGATENTTFRDDNAVEPDLSISPPLADEALRKSVFVTFDTTNDYVVWSGHGLTDGAPVVFRTNGTLPGLVEGQTYYVLNSEDDRFQVAEALDTSTTVNITGGSGEHVATAGAFPAAVGYFEGRRVFAGSRPFPQDFRMTASGTEKDLNYSVPIVDSDRIFFRINVRDANPIRHVVPLSQLLLMTSSAEVRVTPANDDILTPASVTSRPQTHIGADFPQPVMVGNVVVFAAARGGHIREMGYDRQALSYVSGSLSLRAVHLFDNKTIGQIAYQKAPVDTVWCVSSDGKLLSLTYIPEEGIGAWARHTTPDGLYESVAVVPEGDEDAVYVVVNRSGTRYVERMATQFTGSGLALADAVYLDNATSYDGAATTTVKGFDRFNGQTIGYLADGVAGTATIANGTLTLPTGTTASKITGGLQFTSEVETVPLYMQMAAFGSGMSKNVSTLWVRIDESGDFNAKAKDAAGVIPSRVPASGATTTELVELKIDDDWDLDGQVVITQTDPLPLTIAGLTMQVETGN